MSKETKQNVKDTHFKFLDSMSGSDLVNNTKMCKRIEL